MTITLGCELTFAVGVLVGGAGMLTGLALGLFLAARGWVRMWGG